MDERRQPANPDDRWVGDPAGDAFEAALTATEEPYDARLAHIMTVLGPIPPAALGLTAVTRRWPSADLAPAALLAELEAAYALGLRAIWISEELDQARRDDVRWLAARAPLHLIAGPLPLRRFDTGSLDSAGQAGAGMAPPGAGQMAPRRPVPLAGADVYAVPGVESPFTVAVGDDVATLDETARRVAAAWAAGDERWLAGFTADPVTLLERLPLALMAADLPAVAVRRILVENPVLALTMPPASGDDHRDMSPVAPPVCPAGRGQAGADHGPPARAKGDKR